MLGEDGGEEHHEGEQRLDQCNLLHQPEERSPGRQAMVTSALSGRDMRGQMIGPQVWQQMISFVICMLVWEQGPRQESQELWSVLWLKKRIARRRRRRFSRNAPGVQKLERSPTYLESAKVSSTSSGFLFSVQIWFISYVLKFSMRKFLCDKSRFWVMFMLYWYEKKFPSDCMYPIHMIYYISFPSGPPSTVYLVIPNGPSSRQKERSP